MLKTISAALLAASMIAAPALAANSGKTTQTPSVNKTAQAPASTQVPTGKTAQAVKPPGKAGVKASVLNANARMHHKHHRRYHHTSAVRMHSKVHQKHAAIATQRG